ncbi:MAG: metallophosphoesterase, partial [Clostridia bacterium]
MNVKKRILAGALCATMAVSSFAFSATAKENNLPAVNFDENNITLSFGALSDIHQNGSTNSLPEKKFKSALEQLKAKTHNKLDAIFVAGDLTDNGNVAQAQQFKKVYESVLGQDPTKLIYALGNH